MDGYAESARDEYDKLLWSAWHTAVLTNSGSKIPPLKKLLQREPNPTAVQDSDDEDQIAAKQMMAVMMGATRARKIEHAKAQD